MNYGNPERNTRRQWMLFMFGRQHIAKAHDDSALSNQREHNDTIRITRI